MKSELRQETATLDGRLSELRGEMGAGLAGVESRFRQELSELRGEMRAGLAGVESRLTMRMFLFWVGTLGIFLAQKFLT